MSLPLMLLQDWGKGLGKVFTCGAIGVLVFDAVFIPFILLLWLVDMMCCKTGAPSLLIEYMHLALSLIEPDRPKDMGYDNATLFLADLVFFIPYGAAFVVGAIVGGSIGIILEVTHFLLVMLPLPGLFLSDFLLNKSADSNSAQKPIPVTHTHPPKSLPAKVTSHTENGKPSKPGKAANEASSAAPSLATAQGRHFTHQTVREKSPHHHHQGTKARSTQAKRQAI